MSEVNPFLYMRLNKYGWSSSMEEGTQFFPMRDTTSPRTMIYRNECPDELTAFETCLDANNGQSSACTTQKDELEACGTKYFKIINLMETPYNYAKGLPK